MYTAKIDGRTFYEPSLDNYRIFEPKIVMEANKASSFTFRVYPKPTRYANKEYANMTKLKPIITVYDDGELIFRGRILNDMRDWDNAKAITCESEFAFFNDSIVRPYDFTGSVTDYVSFLINQHNEQVDPEKQFQIRNITVTDPNDIIVRSSSLYPSTLSEIADKLFKTLKGYFIFERIEGVTYIDYLIDSPYRSQQAIELGVNLLDLKETVKGDDLATAVIPIGATLNNSDGSSANTKLTIASVNNGKDYLVDSEAASLYGLILKTVEYPDVTTPAVLLARGQSELAKAKLLTFTFDMTAIDRSVIDKRIDKIRILEYVKTKSTPHSIDQDFLITKMSLDLDNPENNKITAGVTFARLTDITVAAINDNLAVTKNLATKGEVQAVKQDVNTAISLIDQTSSSILAQVSETYVSGDDFTTDMNQVSTELILTKNKVDLNFTTLNTAITNQGGSTSAKFSEIEKYIRFEDGNIVLGEVGNELILQLENDRISFLQSGADVAYFSNNKLYVTDANILNSLQIGNFAFTPRSNGNLSFTKVGG